MATQMKWWWKALLGIVTLAILGGAVGWFAYRGNAAWTTLKTLGG